MAARALVAAVSIALASRALAQGSGFGVYEVGLPNQGESYAGMAATADNAGTAFLNPAGMMRLPNTQLLFGPQLYDLRTHFHPDGGSTVAGGDGGDAGGLYGALGTYLVVNASEDYRLGLSINSPFSYAIDYANDWAGRYFVQEWKLETVDIRPSFAFRVDRYLSFGAGADVYYAYNSESAALNASASAEPDGRYTNHADDWKLGYDLGALYEFSPETRVGVTYRSKVDFVMKSHAEFHDPSLVLGPVLNDARYDQKLQLPDNVNLSFYHDFSPRFALLLDVGWTNWSDFTHAPTSLDVAPASVPRNWHDTYRGGIGARYRIAEHWLVQSGYAYDSSPVREENRTPELPVDEQHRVSVGVQHEFSPHVTLGAAYTFAYLGSAPIDRTLDPSSGHLAGQYSPDQVHVVSLSFNFGF